MGMVSRGEVYLINLDPTVGSEDEIIGRSSCGGNLRTTPVQKTRPCVVVSPNEMNQYIRTVIIAPMTTEVRSYKSRVKINFDKREGEVMLDQIRTIDKKRLTAKLGNLSLRELKAVLLVLQEMFT